MERLQRYFRLTWALALIGGIVWLASLAEWLPHTLLAPFLPDQRIERIADGFAISVPPDWEYAVAADVDPEQWWDREEVEDVHTYHEQIVADGGVLLARTRSPFAFHFCVLYDISDYAMEPPAWTSLAHVPSDAQDWTTDSEWALDVRTTFLELPAGPTARADVRWAGGWKESNYYYMEGSRWFRLACGTDDRPPEDRWLSIAETFELEPADVADPAPQRIERPGAAGFAITLPYGWQVGDADDLQPEDWYDPEAVEDVAAHHDAKLAAGILLKARGYLPDEPTLQVCDLYDYTSEDAQAHVNHAGDAQGALAAEADRLDLSVGPAIAIDTIYRDGWSYRDYLVTDGRRWLALVCGSTNAPEDHWLSIAEGLEFLPDEEE